MSEVITGKISANNRVKKRRKRSARPTIWSAAVIFFPPFITVKKALNVDLKHVFEYAVRLGIIKKIIKKIKCVFLAIHGANYRPPSPPSPIIAIQTSQFSTYMKWALNNEWSSDVQFECGKKVFYAHKVGVFSGVFLKGRSFWGVVDVRRLWILSVGKMWDFHL